MFPQPCEILETIQLYPWNIWIVSQESCCDTKSKGLTVVAFASRKPVAWAQRWKQAGAARFGAAKRGHISWARSVRWDDPLSSRLRLDRDERQSAPGPKGGWLPVNVPMKTKLAWKMPANMKINKTIGFHRYSVNAEKPILLGTAAGTFWRRDSPQG